MISHHPETELLLDYASGAQREPLAVLIATHLALCPACRAAVAGFERLGAEVMAELEAEPLSDDAQERILRRLDAEESRGPDADGRGAEAEQRPLDAGAAPPVALGSGERGPVLPQPLRDRVGESLDRLRWRSLGSVAEAEFLRGFPGFRSRLMRIKGGARMPRHTHEGSEVTLVLAGGFTDSGARYVRGDVAVADPSIEHQPIADPGEDCLCLAVSDAPLRLTGPIARHLNPLLRKWL